MPGGVTGGNGKGDSYNREARYEVRQLEADRGQKGADAGQQCRSVLCHVRVFKEYVNRAKKAFSEQEIGRHSLNQHPTTIRQRPSSTQKQRRQRDWVPSALVKAA